MNLTVDRAALVNAVKAARPAVASRPGLDLLGHFLLTAGGDNTLAVAATDLETMIVATCPATVAEGGSATVPAPLFAALLAGIAAPTLTVATEKGKVRLTGTDTKLALPTLDPDDFPTPESWGVPHPLASCPADLFCAAVAQVAHAAASADAIPALEGIHLAFARETLTLTAFDRYRYASTHISVACPNEVHDDAEFIVPAAHLAALAANLPADEMLDICRAGTTLMLDTPALRAHLRTLDGPYPNPVGDNLSDTYTLTARTPRVALREAARLVGLVAPAAGKGRNTKLTLSIGPDRITVAGGQDSFAEITVPLRDPVDGTLAVPLDGTYVADALGALTGGDVLLRVAPAPNPAYAFGMVILAPTDPRDAAIHVIAPTMPESA